MAATLRRRVGWGGFDARGGLDRGPGAVSPQCRAGLAAIARVFWLDFGGRAEVLLRVRELPATPPLALPELGVSAAMPSRF